MNYIGYILMLILVIMVSAENRSLRKRIEKLEWKAGVSECCEEALTMTFKDLKKDIQDLEERMDIRAYIDRQLNARWYGIHKRVRVLEGETVDE